MREPRRARAFPGHMYPERTTSPTHVAADYGYKLFVHLTSLHRAKKPNRIRQAAQLDNEAVLSMMGTPDGTKVRLGFWVGKESG